MVHKATSNTEYQDVFNDPMNPFIFDPSLNHLIKACQNET